MTSITLSNGQTLTLPPDVDPTSQTALQLVNEAENQSRIQSEPSFSDTVMNIASDAGEAIANYDYTN